MTSISDAAKAEAHKRKEATVNALSSNSQPPYGKIPKKVDAAAAPAPPAPVGNEPGAAAMEADDAS